LAAKQTGCAIDCSTSMSSGSKAAQMLTSLILQCSQSVTAWPRAHCGRLFSNNENESFMGKAWIAER
jgi:hypothetical protein